MDFGILTLSATAILAAAIEVILIWYFSSFTKRHTLYFILIFCSWFLPLYQLMLLPVDISSTSYRHCNNSSTGDFCHLPDNFIDEGVLNTIFKGIYWCMQIFTWFLLPMCKGFEYSGNFTILGRIKFTLIENLKYYMLYLLIFIIILIYMVARPDAEKVTRESIQVLLVTTFNTLGMICLIIFMGYGLVDLPRYLWRISDNKTELDRAYFELSKSSDELNKIKEKIGKNIMQLNKASSVINPESTLHSNLLTVIKKLPLVYQVKVDKQYGALVSEPYSSNNIHEKPTFIMRFINLFYKKNRHQDNSQADYTKVKNLEELHYSVIDNVFSYNRCHNLINNYVERATFYEDVVHCSTSYENALRRDNAVYSKYTKYWLPRLEWFWYVKLKIFTLRFVSIAFILFSTLLLFCELSFSSTEPVVSILAIIVISFNNSYFSQIIAQIFYFMVLIYMSACTYITIFQLRLFWYLRVDINHHTSIFSLLSIGSIFCFFTSPICLNFLCLIHFDKGTLFKRNQLAETSFSAIMGRFEILPFVSTYFNIYFPICIIFVCVFAVFSGINRFLSLFGSETLFGNNLISLDMISGGRTIAHREKNKRNDLLSNPPENNRVVHYEMQSSRTALLSDNNEYLTDF